jgi:hypothetical protein
MIVISSAASHLGQHIHRMATAVPRRRSWINSLNFNYIDNAGRRPLKNSTRESTAKYGGAHGWSRVELLGAGELSLRPGPGPFDAEFLQAGTQGAGTEAEYRGRSALAFDEPVRVIEHPQDNGVITLSC